MRGADHLAVNKGDRGTERRINTSLAGEVGEALSPDQGGAAVEAREAGVAEAGAVRLAGALLAAAVGAACGQLRRYGSS